MLPRPPAGGRRGGPSGVPPALFQFGGEVTNATSKCVNVVVAVFITNVSLQFGSHEGLTSLMGSLLRGGRERRETRAGPRMMGSIGPCPILAAKLGGLSARGHPW